jgi:teichuronopeptide biosynthesis TupA-like protein
MKENTLRYFLPSWAIHIRRYWAGHRRVPNLLNPQSFSEKVLYRKLFNRCRIWVQLVDKVAVRDYVQARLGSQILTEIYHVTSDPETIQIGNLPSKFVVKPSHGSGWVRVVADKSVVDQEELRRTCRRWLSESFYRRSREWPYKHVVPRIIIEEYIEDGAGETPHDYKLFVFHGKVRMIQVDGSRFTDHRRRLYEPGWERLPVLFGHEDIVGNLKRPPHLDQMISAAEILGRDFDFVRVDFFDTEEKLYFGELTMAPDAGNKMFRPKEFDWHLGQFWHLPLRPRWAITRHSRMTRESGAAEHHGVTWPDSRL